MKSIKVLIVKKNMLKYILISKYTNLNLILLLFVY